MATAIEASAPSLNWLSSMAFSALSVMMSIMTCLSWMPACRPKLPTAQRVEGRLGPGAVRRRGRAGRSRRPRRRRRSRPGTCAGRPPRRGRGAAGLRVHPVPPAAEQLLHGQGGAVDEACSSPFCGAPAQPASASASAQANIIRRRMQGPLTPGWREATVAESLPRLRWRFGAASSSGSRAGSPSSRSAAWRGTGAGQGSGPRIIPRPAGRPRAPRSPPPPANPARASRAASGRGS